jgi:RHS repeat-associated protein
VDGLGSVVALTDASGNVVDQYEYDVWGAPQVTNDGLHAGSGSGADVENVPQPLWYRSYLYDRELQTPGEIGGWYWLSVRSYDPTLERFIQPDPSEREGTRSYVYCDDDPLDCSDPSGLLSLQDVGVALGVTALVAGAVALAFLTGGLAIPEELGVAGGFGAGTTEVALAGAGFGDVGATGGLAGLGGFGTSWTLPTLGGFGAGGASLAVQVGGAVLVGGGFAIATGLGGISVLPTGVSSNSIPAGSAGIPGRGYQVETVAPAAIPASDATADWEQFLGQGPYTNIHPRNGLPDANRIVSRDGLRSIRFGQHEMNSSPNTFHYHRELWTYDPNNNVMNVDNTLVRVQQQP